MKPHIEYLLRLGDSSLVLGQRLAEWTGHGPVLEEDIARIPIIRKGTSLTPDIMKIRKTHPRSHEPWNKFETTLLDKALDYTNDLEFLSRIFKRGTNSMYISAVKLLALKEIAEAPTTDV